jgi:hypothetical protein
LSFLAIDEDGHGKSDCGQAYGTQVAAEAARCSRAQAFACASTGQTSRWTEAKPSRSQSRGAENDADDAAMKRRTAIALAFVISAVGAATAAPEPERPPAAADPKACAPGEVSPPRDGREETTGAGNNLSDKLARTDGVICPPNVDPEIRAPTPETGRTPVIPPPGSPGGDPNIRPK